MPTNDTAISVRNLTKTYRLFAHPGDRLKQFFSLGLKQYHREFTALKNISFDIKKGETVGIIGRNGSGKSTLLQLISGILKPTSGSVQVNGRVSVLLELGAGFNPEFTGRENVYFQGALMGFTQAQMEERFDEIAAFADIGEFIDQPVRTYSNGMFVRLAFAVSAHIDADIIIIDEALSVGDVYFVQKCIRFLKNFMLKGTVLFVSHDIGAVTQLCQSVFWLNEGMVIESGTPKDVSERYVENSYAVKQGHDNKAFAVDHTYPPPQATHSFGKGGATITHIELINEHGNLVSTVTGQEIFTLKILSHANICLSDPIIGFMIKNARGLELFGDNTFLTYANNPPSVNAGNILEARFTFRMPSLPAGDYVVSVALAEGSQQEHIQHHWVHDALVFKSLNSHTSTGIFSIPMKSISLVVR